MFNDIYGIGFYMLYSTDLFYTYYFQLNIDYISNSLCLNKHFIKRYSNTFWNVYFISNTSFHITKMYIICNLIRAVFCILCFKSIMPKLKLLNIYYFQRNLFHHSISQRICYSTNFNRGFFVTQTTQMYE